MNDFVKCLLSYLLVLVINICLTPLPIFPFLLFYSDRPCNLVHDIAADFVPLQTERQTTEPGLGFQCPTYWPCRLFQSHAHNLGQHLPLTCWNLVWVIRKNLLLWDVKLLVCDFGATDSHSICCWKKLVEELGRDTRSGPTLGGRVTVNKTKQKQTELRNGERALGCPRGLWT